MILYAKKGRIAGWAAQRLVNTPPQGSVSRRFAPRRPRKGGVLAPGGAQRLEMALGLEIRFARARIRMCSVLEPEGTERNGSIPRSWDGFDPVFGSDKNEERDGSVFFVRLEELGAERIGIITLKNT